jgi:hypothetical protein
MHVVSHSTKDDIKNEYLQADLCTIIPLITKWVCIVQAYTSKLISQMDISKQVCSHHINVCSLNYNQYNYNGNEHLQGNLCSDI